MEVLLKKECPWCNNQFLTYEADKQYCSQDCEGKHRYSKLNFADGVKKPTTKNVCKNCGETCGNRSFCNCICRKEYLKKERVANSHKTKIRDNSSLKRVSYDELNRREEFKRVFDNKHAERYIRGK